MAGEFETLVYRGNFSVECSIDFGGVLLSADYGDGYREDAVIGDPNGLRGWSLKYPALLKNVMVQPEGAEPVSRQDYIWNFYCQSKSQGNRPFIIRCPRDGHLYLAIFTEDKLSFQQMDYLLCTTGLSIKQVRVKGVATLEDGSLGSPAEPGMPPNPDEI